MTRDPTYCGDTAGGCPDRLRRDNRRDETTQFSRAIRSNYSGVQQATSHGLVSQLHILGIIAMQRQRRWPSFPCIGVLLSRYNTVAGVDITRSPIPATRINHVYCKLHLFSPIAI